MKLNNGFCKTINAKYPIIQAPMAGVTTPELVLAVSSAGGIGSLGAALMQPDALRADIKTIRAQTDAPFAINLFVPFAKQTINNADLEKSKHLLAPLRSALNIQAPKTIVALELPFEEQLQVVLDEKVPIFSFTFGYLPKDLIAQLKANGTFVIGTATTVKEAKKLEALGVDAVVAQGSEAGGHRGSAADTNIQDALIGTMALVPQVVDAVKIPVIASGGIMDARGIAAALMLGASAVQMGTAFLACPEASVHPKHHAALLASKDESTSLTRAFTGRYARSIKNKFMLELAAQEASIPSYVLQSAYTKDIRSAAAQQNNPDYMSLWSGQAASLCQAKPAAELIAEWVDVLQRKRGQVVF